MTWTNEQIEFTKKHYGESMTAAQIGEAIGKSKNAVIGFMNRAAKPKPPSRPHLVYEDYKPSKSHKPKTLEQWKRGMCQYPIQRNRAGVHVFCCAGVHGGYDYCLPHARLCYTKKI